MFIIFLQFYKFGLNWKIILRVFFSLQLQHTGPSLPCAKHLQLKFPPERERFWPGCICKLRTSPSHPDDEYKSFHAFICQHITGQEQEREFNLEHNWFFCGSAIIKCAYMDRQPRQHRPHSLKMELLLCFRANCE